MKPTDHFLNFAKYLKECGDKSLSKQLEAAHNLVLTAKTIVNSGYDRRLRDEFSSKMRNIEDADFLSLVDDYSGKINLVSQFEKCLPFIGTQKVMADHLNDVLGGSHKDELRGIISNDMENTGVLNIILGANACAHHAQMTIPFIVNTLKAVHPESLLLKEEMPGLN
jgi:hypothetical protein